jgi:hypothetical protein
MNYEVDFVLFPLFLFTINSFEFHIEHWNAETYTCYTSSAGFGLQAALNLWDLRIHGKYIRVTKAGDGR